jgi:hypothetical protein
VEVELPINIACDQTKQHHGKIIIPNAVYHSKANCTNWSFISQIAVTAILNSDRTKRFTCSPPATLRDFFALASINFQLEPTNLRRYAMWYVEDGIAKRVETERFYAVNISLLHALFRPCDAPRIHTVFIALTENENVAPISAAFTTLLTPQKGNWKMWLTRFLPQLERSQRTIRNATKIYIYPLIVFTRSNSLTWPTSVRYWRM